MSSSAHASVPGRWSSILLILLVAGAAAFVRDETPVAAAGARADRATVALIVRHGEKAAPDGDPVLSEAGVRRAQELARVAGAAGVEAIYATTLQRTSLTAEPLAARLGLRVQRLPADDVEGLARRVLLEHRGGTVLIVGHSNTIPDLVERLGAERVAIGDDQYDDLFVVFREPDGAARLVRLRYGERG